MTLRQGVDRVAGRSRRHLMWGRWSLWGSTAALGAVLSLGGCGSDQGPVPPPPPTIASVTVSPATASLLPGETRQLAAVARTASGQTVSGTPSWSSSTPGTASVSATGLVTALSPGQTTMTAVIGGQLGTAVVSVEVPTATLTVVVGSGVVSSLAAGTTTHPVGTQLPYTFSARPGYEAPVAWLEENPAPLTGVVTVNQDLSLVAMADSIIVLPPEDQPLADKLLAIRTTTDPATAWQVLQAEMGLLYQTVGAISARERLLRAIAVTLDPVLDAGPLWQAMQAGLDAGLPDGVARAPLGVPISACPRLPTIGAGVEVAFIYVNGINTLPSEACTTATDHLWPILKEVGFDDAIKFPVGVSRNSSMKGEDGRPWVCLTVTGVKHMFNREASFWSKLQECPGLLGDLGEAQIQRLATSPPIPDSERLASVIEGVWAQGGRAIIVAHSQGNLLAREALAILRATKPVASMACVGVASIAPPAPIHRSAPEPSVGNMIIQGIGAMTGSGSTVRSQDILLLHPGIREEIVSVFKIATEQSGQFDQDLAAQRGDAGRIPLALATGYLLHSIDDSYLKSNATVTYLQSMIAAQVATVTNGCPVPPGAPTIALNPASVAFNTSAGAPLPPSRIVNVTSGGGGTLAGLSVAALAYTAGQPTGWLSAPTLSSTTAPATLTLRPNTTNLPPGVYTATVSVGAAGSVVNSPVPLSVTYTVTAGPSGPTAPVLIGPGSATAPGPVLSTLPPFTWNAASGATGYGLYIRDLTAPGMPLIYPNASGTTATPLTGTSFTLPTGVLQPGRAYRWGMTSFAGTAESSQSPAWYFQTQAQGSTLPAAPSNLAASPGQGFASLAWSDNSNNEDGFRVERAPEGSPTFVEIATTGPNVAAHLDHTVVPGSTYQYRVRAYNTAGTSGPSNTVSLTMPGGSSILPAPSGLNATVLGSHTVKLAWQDNSTDEDGFYVEVSATPEGPFTLWWAATPDAVESLVPAEPGTTSYFRVAAYRGEMMSPYSATISATTLSPFPGLYSGMSTSIVSGQLYVVGGYINGPTSFTYVYDHMLDTWEHRSSWSCSLGAGNCIAGSAAVTIGQKIYLIGGSNFWGFTGELRVYDTGSDTWTQMAPLPKPAAPVGAGIFDNQIYVVARTSSLESITELFQYNLSSDSWIELGVTPFQAGGGTGVAFGGRLYVFGAEDHLLRPNGVHIYDPSTGLWSTGSSMPTSRLFAAAAVANGKIVIAGGSGNTGFLDSVEVYDPLNDTWTSWQSLTSGRASPGLAVIGGRIYAIGGNRSNTIPPFGSNIIDILPVPQ